MTNATKANPANYWRDRSLAEAGYGDDLQHALMARFNAIQCNAGLADQSEPLVRVRVRVRDSWLLQAAYFEIRRLESELAKVAK